MRDGRDEDLQQLQEQYRNARSQKERREIEEAGEAIKRQRMNGKVSSMRERLIKEMRAGNTANVKDINEYIKKKPQYQE